MKILVSNIGSTSFKFRLFDMAGGEAREIAAGAADRIDGAGGRLQLRIAGGEERVCPRNFADHGQAIEFVLEQLVAGGALGRAGDLDAVAFKAVMGGDCEPVAMVDKKLLERMEYFVPVAPAHNPPYIAAMRMFRKALGDTPLVAAFEPGFHRTIAPRRRYYAVPMKWAEQYGVKRYGFHGASHRYIATRTRELMGATGAGRIISCHLGGSSSICAIRDGKSAATSMGLSPQSGLPQSNRAGEFDPFAFALLRQQGGMDCEAVLKALGSDSGLAALSGTSGDMRDIRAAADAGNKRAKLTIDLFVTAVRDYIGAYLVELGGADAIVFTGGIGQNNPQLRADICSGLEFAGIRLDSEKNRSAEGECRIEAADSPAAIWVMPTNEELIVARQAAELLNSRS
ncbi:MAG: acetate/propionate family kinase [Phycisphaerae bacterium]|nr:acetate/propionate family kinase [Phycisphaerae bacterium]